MILRMEDIIEQIVEEKIHVENPDTTSFLNVFCSPHNVVVVELLVLFG